MYDPARNKNATTAVVTAWQVWHIAAEYQDSQRKFDRLKTHRTVKVDIT